jgi:hypothetical protein
MFRSEHVLLAFLLSLGACGLPEAPEDLYELGAWLYAHHAVEDPSYREVGFGQLLGWLDTYGEEAASGYEVAGLSRDDVKDLNDGTHDVGGILGIAVATPSDFSVDEQIVALLETDQEEISPARYTSYDREWLGSLGAFTARLDERIESVEQVDVALPAGVTSHQEPFNQYVWVDAASGESLLQRAWLPEPGQLSVDWLVVYEQYYLNALLPREGGCWRLQITWVVADTGFLPESSFKEMSADSMAGLAADTEVWLAGR